MRLARLLVLLPALLTASSALAGASFLTGTYEGRYSCRIDSSNGRSSFNVPNSVLLVTHDGFALRVDIDGVPYSGSIVETSANRGVGAFVACGTSDAESFGQLNEIELIRWRVENNGRGSIRKDGVFVSNGIQIGTCQGEWTRQSTANPNIPACN
jgi:hypothetical protein